MNNHPVGRALNMMTLSPAEKVRPLIPTKSGVLDLSLKTASGCKAPIQDNFSSIVYIFSDLYSAPR